MLSFHFFWKIIWARLGTGQGREEKVSCRIQVLGWFFLLESGGKKKTKNLLQNLLFHPSNPLAFLSRSPGMKVPTKTSAMATNNMTIKKTWACGYTNVCNCVSQVQKRRRRRKRMKKMALCEEMIFGSITDITRMIICWLWNCCTFCSHSIPTMVMLTNTQMVTTPMILMSFNSPSTIVNSLTFWREKKGLAWQRH